METLLAALTGITLFVGYMYWYLGMINEQHGIQESKHREDEFIK